MKKLHKFIARLSVVFALLCTALFAASVNAQDTCRYALKNTVEVGGAFSLRSSTYFEKVSLTPSGAPATYTNLPEYDLSFSPSIGWFPIDGLELEFGFTFASQSGNNGGSNYSSFQSAAFAGVAYNFYLDSSFFPFVEILGVRYASGYDYYGGNDDARYGWRAGFKFIISNSILLNVNAQMLYNSSEFTEFSAGAGFSYIL